jgi:hypothetical protein
MSADKGTSERACLTHTDLHVQLLVSMKRQAGAGRCVSLTVRQVITTNTDADESRSRSRKVVELNQNLESECDTAGFYLSAAPSLR